MTSTRDPRGAASRLDAPDRFPSRPPTSRVAGEPDAGPRPAQRRFYSVAQVARMFGISSVTLYRAINAGEFPAVRIRGRLIVPAQALDRMADAAVAEHTLIDPA